jgi:hypothetical protein
MYWFTKLRAWMTTLDENRACDWVTSATVAAATCRDEARRRRGEQRAGPGRGASAGGVHPQVGHAGLLDLSGRWQTVQVFAASFEGARPDAASISREVETAADYPMVAANYAAQRSEASLGKHIARGAIGESRAVSAKS